MSSQSDTMGRLVIVAAGLGILVRSVAPGWCDPRAPVEK